MGAVPKNGLLGGLPGFVVDSRTLVLLSMVLSARGEICAFYFSDDVLAPLAVCGTKSMVFFSWLTS